MLLHSQESDPDRSNVDTMFSNMGLRGGTEGAAK
jgi:hypothetical protein